MYRAVTVFAPNQSLAAATATATTTTTTTEHIYLPHTMDHQLSAERSSQQHNETVLVLQPQAPCLTNPKITVFAPALDHRNIPVANQSIKSWRTLTSLASLASRTQQAHRDRASMTHACSTAAATAVTVQQPPIFQSSATQCIQCRMATSLRQGGTGWLKGTAQTSATNPGGRV